LNRFDRETETFHAYRANPDDPNTLSNDYIFSIYEDKKGLMWVGTWGGGLNRFDRKNGSFKYYTMKDGLPNDAIYAVLEDKKGYLWLSTNNGISKFNPRTEVFKNYNIRDGLQSNEFNGGSFFHSKTGEMFFGGINGINAYYPEQIKDNPHIPPVVITSFRKFNEVVNFEKPVWEVNKINLSYRDYIFSFEFAGLDFTAPEKNRYAYKMEGLDDEWIYTSAQKRYAEYTTLSPGHYIFRVKASNNDGIWNKEGTSVRIVITPPFWQSWWFVLLSALTFIALVYLVYSNRLKQVRMKAELQAAHDAQMSIMPHADPHVPGFDISGICIPANEVGGDFFDYLWLEESERRFGIVVGDVSGKAMKAAMMAVMASGVITAEARNGKGIKEILRSSNQTMFDKTDRQMFTAVCLAAFQVKEKRLIFTNAGLIEPVIKSNGSVDFLSAKGSTHPLGMIEDNKYDEKVMNLKSGDLLVFVSDGVPEARNPNREQYGEERLKAFLEKMDTSSMSAQDIKKNILEDVQQFSGSAPVYDDMTVVVVKVK
jgi:serine phosphatase RsbU (regulator of sigma subunit)